MTLNKEELFVGAFYGLLFAPVLGWLAVPLGIWTSFAWALGGTYNKAWRRFGCSLVPAILISAQHGWHHLFSFPMAWAALSIGYGIPSQYPPDDGSVMGRIVYSVLKDETRATIAVRTMIFLLLFFAFWIPFVF